MATESASAAIDFDKNGGVVAAIAVDHVSHRVLMVGLALFTGGPGAIASVFFEVREADPPPLLAVISTRSLWPIWLVPGR